MGRGFSAKTRPAIGVPGVVNIPGTKTSSILDAYGDRHVAVDLAAQTSAEQSQPPVTDVGISRSIIGPYQIPNDTTESWYLDVWDSQAQKYKTILLPSGKIYDVTASPSANASNIEFVRDEYEVTDTARRIYPTAYGIVANSEVVSVNGLVQLPGLTRQYVVQNQAIKFVFDVDLYVGDVIHIQYAKIP